MAVLFKEDFLTKVTAIHFASGGAVMLIRGSEDVSFHNEPFKGKFDFFYSSEPDVIPSTIPLLNAPNSLPKFTAPTGPVELKETITSDMKNAFYMWRYPSAVVNDSGARFWQSVTVFNFGKIKSKLATAALAQSSTRLNLGMTFSWAGGSDESRVITNRFLINVATFKNIKALRPTLAAVDTVLDVVDGTRTDSANGIAGWSPVPGNVQVKTPFTQFPNASEVEAQFPLHVIIDMDSGGVRITAH